MKDSQHSSIVNDHGSIGELWQQGVNYATRQPLLFIFIPVEEAQQIDELVENVAMVNVLHKNVNDTLALLGEVWRLLTLRLSMADEQFVDDRSKRWQGQAGGYERGIHDCADQIDDLAHVDDVSEFVVLLGEKYKKLKDVREEKMGRADLPFPDHGQLLEDGIDEFLVTIQERVIDSKGEQPTQQKQDLLLQRRVVCCCIHIHRLDDEGF